VDRVVEEDDVKEEEGNLEEARCEGEARVATGLVRTCRVGWVGSGGVCEIGENMASVGDGLSSDDVLPTVRKGETA